MEHSDHSVRAYLERLPTTKLLAAIDDYTAAPTVDVIPLALQDMLEVLIDRNSLYDWRLSPYIEKVKALIKRAEEHQRLLQQTWRNEDGDPTDTDE